jgi:hypothetical protein
MKKITCLGLLASILFLAKTTTAQTAIAVTNDSGSTFYSTLDSAITKAVSGDYIYLPGGSFTISVPINKQLQIIGVGHNPDSCAVTGITHVTGYIYITKGSDHGSMTGLNISGSIYFSSDKNGNYSKDINISYYSIERCKILGGVYIKVHATNILINECILDYYSARIESNGSGYADGFQISKCILNVEGIYLFDSNTYFTNNIFIADQTNLSQVYNCYFRNNVFRGALVRTDYSQYCSNNLFQNNLLNGISSLSTNNFFSNNITGPVTTLFKNQSGTVFDYKQDYHILDTSPAHNAGTDGTDLGIYGTGSPWKEGSLPSNPHIQSKTISTVNGNLNVKIKVAAQDN